MAGGGNETKRKESDKRVKESEGEVLTENGALFSPSRTRLLPPPHQSKLEVSTHIGAREESVTYDVCSDKSVYYSDHLMQPDLLKVRN